MLDSYQKIKFFISFFLLLSVFNSGWAQSISPNLLPASNSSEIPGQQYSDLVFANTANITQQKNSNNIELNETKDFGTVNYKKQLPFGHNLFSGSCNKANHSHYLNPDYRISIGDKLNIQIWGAYQFGQEMIVDTQGNIFLPEIGPVKLQGVANKHLNLILKQKLKTVFLKDVHIYGDLLTAQPVQIYVAGAVSSPGLYDGLSSDSIIYYLCQAGGIRAQDGSYRDIKVMRSKQLIKEIDLYDFLANGKIEAFQLHQGDVIFVGPLRSTVSVEGNVKSPYTYEMKQETITMRELIRYAHPQANVTHVRVDSHQGTKPLVHYYPVSKMQQLLIQAGDHLVFTSDQSLSQVVVTVTGEVEGPHQYVLKKGQTLDGFLRALTFSEEADLENVQLFRQSVAEQQKLAVESSLARLERQALTNQNITSSGATLQVAQSKLIGQFIEHAKKAKFRGQVVLGPQQEWRQVVLYNNDAINIPRKDDVVTIGGEVMNATSVELESRKSCQDYIHDAGGFTEAANQKKVLLIHKNGQSELIENTGRASSKIIKPGDMIIVLSKPPSESWQISESLTQIMYRVALAAKAAVLL